MKDFMAEAEDILMSANQTVLLLDAGLASGTCDPDHVNALFRAIHSFKGLAGMFGLREPSELAHKLEFLLDELRLGKVGLSHDVLDVFSETTALLKRLLQQTGTQEQIEDISKVQHRIEGILATKPSTDVEKPLNELITLDQGILQVLTEYEEHRLRECIRQRKNLYSIRTAFQLADFETAIKLLNTNLKEHGEIICTLPTTGGESGTSIGFTMIIATVKERESVASAIALPNATIKQMVYGDGNKTEQSKVDTIALKSISNTVRVDIYKLDNLMNIVGELHQIRNIMGRIVRELRTTHSFSNISVDLQKAERNLMRKVNDLQVGILEARMVPVGQIFTRLSHMVKKYAREAGKEIDLQFLGEETELDKLMIEDLADPLLHLIRNAIDHGIEYPSTRRELGKSEKGVVKLAAFPKGNHVVITVEDDGAGMDAGRMLTKAVETGVLRPDHGLDPYHDRKDILDLIYIPGFTTREFVSEISGRGVGMDVVKRNVAKLSGMVDIYSEPGVGTSFTLTLPITLAIIKALIVVSGEDTFAIPLSSVLEIIQATKSQIETVEGREVMAVRDDTIPLLRLARVFNFPEDSSRDTFNVILVGMAERRLGLIVDSLRDQQEIVIKALGKRLSEIPGIAGATELGDKRGVVMVLDIESLIEGALKKTAASR
jgi:two-component system, chemotaxis family, sensor kinase CheA